MAPKTIWGGRQRGPLVGIHGDHRAIAGLRINLQDGGVRVELQHVQHVVSVHDVVEEVPIMSPTIERFLSIPPALMLVKTRRQLETEHLVELRPSEHGETRRMMRVERFRDCGDEIFAIISPRRGKKGTAASMRHKMR